MSDMECALLIDFSVGRETCIRCYCIDAIAWRVHFEGINADRAYEVPDFMDALLWL